MMTADDLTALRALHDAASPAPWHVLHANDGMGMSATLVTKNPSAGRFFDRGDDGWMPEDVVAACLLQSNGEVASDDGEWDTNAALIATMRNALPELLRLARLGLDGQAGSS